MTNSMMLITGTWNEQKTFKLIPTKGECPFNEAIYDLGTRTLALVSKEKKQIFHMLPKLTEAGDIAPLKKPRSNGKSYPEERKLVDTFYEYYIEDSAEIESFIKNVAVNAGTYDFKSYMVTVESKPAAVAA